MDRIVTEIKKNNNHYVLKELYNTLLPKIHHFVCTNNGNEEDAKDLFQETVLKFLDKVLRDEIDVKTNVKAYIYKMAKNKWIDIKRKRTIQTVELSGLEIPLNGLQNKEETLINQDMAMCISAVLAEVDDSCRRLLHEIVINKETFDVVAEKLGYRNANVVKSTFYNCKKRIVKMIKESPKFSDIFD